MTEPLTPQREAERADRLMEGCRRRQSASLADVEQLKNSVHDLAAELEQVRGELAKYVGHEPTLTEEALYAHEVQVRERIADDLHRADLPTFAKTEDPVLVVKTARAIDVRLVSGGPAAPYYVAPKAGDR